MRAKLEFQNKFSIRIQNDHHSLSRLFSKISDIIENFWVISLQAPVTSSAMDPG